MKKYIETLLNNPLFSGMDCDSISSLLKDIRHTEKSFKKGEFIAVMGDPADFIGIILSGKIKILQDDFKGNRNIIALLSEGDLFAEAFAPAGVKLLPLDIMSETDSKVLFLSASSLLSPGNELKQELIQNLLRISSRKNMFLNRKLNYISQKTTREKLLCYLYDQARASGSNSFTIPFDRQGLADFLSVERSAMSAEISKLQKDGILSTKRSHFILHML